MRHILPKICANRLFIFGNRIYIMLLQANRADIKIEEPFN